MLPATTKHFLYCFTWSLTHCLLQTQVDIVWRVNSTGIAKATRDESWISQQSNLTLFCPRRRGVDRGWPLLHTFFSNITNKCCLSIAIIAVQDLSSWVFFFRLGCTQTNYEQIKTWCYYPLWVIPPPRSSFFQSS